MAADPNLAHLRRLCGGALTLLLLVAFSASGAAARQQKPATAPGASDDVPPPFAVDEWVRGPNREDYRWHVELSSPRLTYQQRNLIVVKATVDGNSLRSDGGPSDLFFVLKVADAQGHWFDGDTHNHFTVPPKLDKSSDIEFVTGYYSQPGDYTVAVLMYDATTRRSNVWRKNVHVPAIKHDPLPSLDRDIPAVEFMTEVPQDLESTRLSRHGAVVETSTEWPAAASREILPVRNPRPLRLDVLLNFSPWQDPIARRQVSEAIHRVEIARLVHIGSLLSHLELTGGCVKLTAFDLSVPALVFDRVDGATADWKDLAAEAKKTNHSTVDVRALQTPSLGAAFLRDLLASTANTAGCGGSDAGYDHAIVVVSHSFAFPAGVHVQEFAPSIECSCRFYLVRVGSRMNAFNDMDKVLKNLHPILLDAESPEKFRKALAELIASLSELPNTKR